MALGIKAKREEPRGVTENFNPFSKFVSFAEERNANLPAVAISRRGSWQKNKERRTFLVHSPALILLPSADPDAVSALRRKTSFLN
jgi:hypothetical protein